MSGYFQRLMARSASGGSDIRPLSRQPGAIPLEPSVGDYVVDVPQLLDQPQARVRAERGKVSTANTREPSSTVSADATATRASDTPARSIGISANESGSVTADTSETDASALRTESGAHRAHEQGRDTSETDASALRTARASQATAPEQEAYRSAGEFRLMASHPPSPRDAAPSLPFTQAHSAPGAQVQAANLSLSGRHGQQPGEHGPTEVHVSIGRIEVTAVQAPMPAKRARVSERKAMSLDEYLARRQQGRA